MATVTRRVFIELEHLTDGSKVSGSSANVTEHAFNLNIALGVLLTGHAAVSEAIEHVGGLD